MDAMHKEIQTLFIDGVNEVFSTLFNDGEQEGVYFYPQLETSDIDEVYDEKKDKVFGDPVLLVSRVQIHMEQDKEEVKVGRGNATFTIPLKSLLYRGVDVDVENFAVLKQGIIKYNNTYFVIEEIQPHAFVEQVFLLYDFQCRQMMYSDLEELNYYFTEDNEEVTQLTAEDLEEDGE